MALPRKAEISITYDETIAKAVNEGEDYKTEENISGAIYVVKPGDTLWRIAKNYLGNGTKHTVIYAANAEVIESTARAHGKNNSENGHWIWAGTVLSIPGKETDGTNETKKEAVSLTNNSGLGERIEKKIEGFSYTDVASGQSDSISITMNDINKEWLGKYRPKKGAGIGAKIRITNWNNEGSSEEFDCGNFILDDVSFSGRPLTCIMKGVSVPTADDFKSLKKTHQWKNTTIKEIASKIAQEAGIMLCYDADIIQIQEIEQDKQTDSAFLYSICEKYGLGMKVYNHKIVILDLVKYEEKKAVLTLYEEDLIKWNYNETIDGTYTGVNLYYTDPDAEESINVLMGESGRMYAMNVQAAGKYDAELQAAAKVNEANRNMETLSVTIKAIPLIVATQCIQIAGLESIDGKYFVDKVSHKIDSNGYKMDIGLHRIQTPIRVMKPAISANKGGNTYTVVSGDTLWAISKKFYGTGTKHGIIYRANMETIESTARLHGKKNSKNGHWIWKGENLFIPEE